MGDRRIAIGSSQWRFPDGDVTDTVKQIKQALATGAVAEVELVDSTTGRTVLVYLNGAAAHTVELDLGGAPRPSEISGSAKRLTIGASEWKLPGGDVTGTVDKIKQALTNRTIADVQLVNAANRSVNVLLNGGAVDTVAVDLGGGPRPSEISGS